MEAKVEANEPDAGLEVTYHLVDREDRQGRKGKGLAFHEDGGDGVHDD